MFICNSCLKCTKPREKLTRVPVEIREKRYPRRELQSFTVEGFQLVDEGGMGFEIVKEVSVCTRCLPEIQSKTPVVNIDLVNRAMGLVMEAV